MSEHAFLSVICRADTKYVCCPLDRDVNWRPCAGRVTPCAGYRITYTNLFQNISMWSYLVGCRLQKRAHLLKKKTEKKEEKSLPTLPYFLEW